MSRVYTLDDLPMADFAVIGDPVGHSKSPAMHHAAYDALGLPYRYVAVHVAPGRVAEALERMREMGYRGVNVTVPHKAEALAWASQPDSLASRIGAANTVDLRTGRAWNTDAPGFMDTLVDLGLRSPYRAVVLGAGGSARALVAALSDEAAVEVAVWNRTRDRAERMVQELAPGAQVLDRPDLTDADLVVNATSTGLSGIELDLDFAATPPDALAYDLAYGSEPTAFERQAASVGRRQTDGRGLLAAQGARAFEHWLGIPAPKAVMLRAIT
ncbi:MAG: shikimate dehydrogenase [Nitrospirae bacterium]|nr:shikimate dehydrogenase [Fimbriimonadaceae bacterium]